MLSESFIHCATTGDRANCPPDEESTRVVQAVRVFDRWNHPREYPIGSTLSSLLLCTIEEPAKLLLLISGIVVTDLALVSAVSRCLHYVTLTAYRTATVVHTSSVDSGRNFSNSYDDSVELWLCQHVVRTKEADQPSITPEEWSRYKKNDLRDLGIYRCSAGLSTLLCASMERSE